MKQPQLEGIPLKKRHGQYFLRDINVVHDMLSAVSVKNNSVFEVGCGDGFLTREITAQNPARLWVFEIDEAWAKKVGQELSHCKELTIHHTNFLDVDLHIFEHHRPWVFLSNLPYHVTFPILKRIQKIRHLIDQGVIMVQEEVAQKIVKTGGRGFGYISLFFQHYFEWRLLTKVPPSAFYPQPKVFSRLMHFVPRKKIVTIPEEEKFWKFIKLCFSQPRRTLKNNLLNTHFDLAVLSDERLSLRAQQMSFDELLSLWDLLR